jgi:hypothetical protein
MTPQDYKAPDESLNRVQQRALIAGGIGVVLCGIGYFKNPDDFFRSYLFAFLFVLGLSLGSLGILMTQHLTGGDWGVVIRRPLESATRVLVLVAVFFLPIFFGMKHLYSVWLNAPPSGEGALSEFEQRYLTPSGFRVRAIIYFVVWGILVFLFNRWSREQDVNREDRGLRRRLKMLAGPGIILYVMAMSFAAIDWVMSLSPHWTSTIYGFIFIASQLISSMSLMAIVVVLLAETEPFSRILQKRHTQDLGSFLLTFLMLWAYFSFSQLLIIWSGNLPQEISFYQARLYGEWGVVAVILVIFGFFVPFFLLLSSDLKRSFKGIAGIAVWLILMRFVDLYWITRPDFTEHALPSWMDIAALLALVGLWVFVFAGQLKRMPLLPLGDPKLEEAMEHHEH